MDVEIDGKDSYTEPSPSTVPLDFRISMTPNSRCIPTENKNG